MLKNAYEYLESQGYNVDKYKSNVAISYDNELEMELREDIVYYGFEKPCKLYMRDMDGATIFDEYKIIGLDKFDIADRDYIVCSLMDCLRVSTLQNDLFDRDLEAIDKENGF